MIVHLFKQITNHWRSNLWILVELLLVFISLFVCCNMLARIVSRVCIERGFDTEHVYKVNIDVLPTDAPGYRTGVSDGETLKTLASRLKAYPGVECLGVAPGHFSPYAWGYGSMMVYNDTLSAKVRFGEVSPGFTDVFRLQPVTQDDRTHWAEYDREWVLMTPDVMEQLFGKGVMKGRADLENRGHRIHTCVNVGRLSVNEYDKQEGIAIFISSEERLLQSRGSELFIRVRPEADEGFVPTFFKTMKGRLSVNNHTITDLIPMGEVRSERLTATGVYKDIYLVVGLTTFFMLCVLLGVVGTFWFRTEARTVEIGLRMALGATRGQVRRQMIGEGLMLLALVWVPALGISYGLREVIFIDRIATYVLDMPELLYFGWVAAATTGLMLLLIVAGIWYPARQASKVNPVKALHDE